MNRSLLLLVLVAAPAFADVPPPEGEPCAGKAAGERCTTWDKQQPGHCVERTIQPPAHKVAYGAKPYQLIVCEPLDAKPPAPVKKPAAPGKKSSSAPSPWPGFAFSFVALAGALATRKS